MVTMLRPGGALQAGIAFSNSSFALVHGMSQPIGAYFHVPHGVSNAALDSRSPGNNPLKDVLELENYINGGWVKSESQEIKDVINPATQKVLAKVPMSTHKVVTAAIKAAQEAFPEWRRTAPLARVRCLFRLKELLEENFEELSRVQTKARPSTNPGAELGAGLKWLKWQRESPH